MSDKKKPLDVLGAVLLGGGALLLAACFLWASIATKAYRPPGDLPALAIMTLIVGLLLTRPELLKDGNDASAAMSSMRVIAFGLTTVFTILFVRNAWSAEHVPDLTIDPGWTVLLSAAIGAKAVQSFSERSRPPAPPDQPPPDIGG